MWLYVLSKVQIVCTWSSWCHCIPKPHNLLRHLNFFNPFLNPDWFYLSDTGLPRLSWKRGCVVSYCMWCLSWLLSSLLPVLIHCMYCACRWAGNIILVSTVVCGWRTAREGFGSQWTTAGSAAVSNKAVIDRKLCRRCCHLGSYFKHTSFSCHYIRMDIMCKHDVINIQHTLCGLVGPDCKK